MFAGITRDVHLSLRALTTTQRVVTLTAILTLGLAIGSSTAVFAVVNALLLRPLPVSEPDRLFSISSDMAVANGFNSGAGWSAAMWDALRRRSGAFAGTLAWQPHRFAIGRAGDAVGVDGYFTSVDFFTTLGVMPARGRLFSADDERPAAAMPAVVSHRFWQERLGGVDDVVGVPLLVNGLGAVVIGVAPPAFRGLEAGKPVDIAVPLAAEPAIRGRDAAVFNPRRYLLFVMLRLRPGQSIESATQSLREIQPEIVGAGAPAFAQQPMTLVPAATGAMSVASPQRVLRQPLLLLLVSGGGVLLIACVNITHLLLALTTWRRGELGVRVAMGASGWRLARLLMTDSVLLSIASAVVGLVVAIAGSRLIIAIADLAVEPAFDSRAALFVTGLTLIVSLLVGASPACRARRVMPAEVLKSTGRGTGTGAGRLASLLVVTQVTLAFVLLVGAGLLARTSTLLAGVPLGFDVNRVLIASVNTARSQATHLDDLHRRLVEAVKALPGVEQAAASLWTPMSGDGALVSMRVPGAAEGAELGVPVNFVTPGWFTTYGMTIKAGRDVAAADTEAAPKVGVVNEAFARRFGLDSAIGRVTPDGHLVVGVVSDAVSRSSLRIPGVTSVALREPVPPTMYAPLAQLKLWDRPPGEMIRLSVRPIAGSPHALAPSIARSIGALDADLVFEFRLLANDVRAALGQERTAAAISVIFGAISVLLAAVGLYGVTSLAVAGRHTEIGVRLAFGATPAAAVRMALGRAMSMVGLGVIVGIAAAAALSRFLDSQLHGISPWDWPTFLGAGLVLSVVGALAALVPAMRAARVDPAAALRGR